jgi:hypothetical protein
MTMDERVTAMNKTQALIAGALLLAFAPAVLAQGKGAASASKKLYCWNDNGRKVCGDALPASAVNNERTEISAKSGMTTARVGRALTAEERVAAAEQARAEALAEAEAAARVRRERAMADSYATESELRRAYENRMLLLEETVKASELGIQGLRQSLVSLLRRASEAELTGKRVGGALSGNIRNQHLELLRQQTLLTQQRQERLEVEGEFQAAVERYRELKSAGSENG